MKSLLLCCILFYTLGVSSVEDLSVYNKFIWNEDGLVIAKGKDGSLNAHIADDKRAVVLRNSKKYLSTVHKDYINTQYERYMLKVLKSGSLIERITEVIKIDDKPPFKAHSTTFDSFGKLMTHTECIPKDGKMHCQTITPDLCRTAKDHGARWSDDTFKRESFTLVEKRNLAMIQQLKKQFPENAALSKEAFDFDKVEHETNLERTASLCAEYEDDFSSEKQQMPKESKEDSESKGSSI